MSAADDLAAARNDAVRAALLLGLRAAAPVVRRSLLGRIGSYANDQARLRARLGVRPDTPIRPWGPEVEAAVEAWARRRTSRGVGIRWAETSGSTARPKRVPFDRPRLDVIRRASWEAAVQAGAAHGVTTPTLFVLAGLAQDASLSSLLLEDRRAREGTSVPGEAEGWWQREVSSRARGLASAASLALSPSLVRGLVMPSRWLWTPDAAPLLDAFGATAARVFLLAASDPGFLYATNPSTLAVFLDRLEAGWDDAARLCRAFVAGDAPPAARLLLRRTAAAGWAGRLRAVAAARAAPPLEAWLPRLRCWVSWDGGYVAPFLERVRRALPAPRFAHVPMYSMSTETLETTTVWLDGEPRFLPLAPGVLHELLPEGAPDDPRLLLPATAAEPGRTYALVVSDLHGLVRYQTADLFRCEARVRGLPDLRFLRRRGLAYSFTGEKLTGEQVVAAFDLLRAREPALAARGVQLALLPSTTGLPHYRLALAWPGPPDPAHDADGAARALDELLGAQNAEYAAKRRSARLGPVVAEPVAYDRLAAALQHDAWETQFKLLPLVSRPWEALGLPPRHTGPA